MGSLLVIKNLTDLIHTLSQFHNFASFIFIVKFTKGFLIEFFKVLFINMGFFLSDQGDLVLKGSHTFFKVKGLYTIYFKVFSQSIKGSKEISFKAIS